jgi:hypothetical protein
MKQLVTIRDVLSQTAPTRVSCRSCAHLGTPDWRQLAKRYGELSRIDRIRFRCSHCGGREMMIRAEEANGGAERGIWASAEPIAQSSDACVDHS